MASDNPSGEPDDQQERPLSPWYVTGFMDGEGCFCASVHRHPTARDGWYIGPTVQAYQHQDRVEILMRLSRVESSEAIRQTSLARGRYGPTCMATCRAWQNKK